MPENADTHKKKKKLKLFYRLTEAQKKNGKRNALWMKNYFKGYI